MAADSAPPPPLEPRQIELADRLVDVLAPPGWPDARVEAWLEDGEVLFEGLDEPLVASILRGEAAPARSGFQAAVVVDIESIEFDTVIGAHLGQARATEAAAASATLIAARLSGVMDAFGRCEGEPEA
ncbi:MAG: ribonucleotide reductase, partial [Caulobacteraceae bacterium]|nr:ribonucleotide reductase [Caulobacteraceae bacterium]